MQKLFGHIIIFIMRRMAVILSLLAFLVFNLPGSQRVYLRNNEALTLDPDELLDFYSAEVVSNVFEGLLILGPDNQLQPGLAENWNVSPDGLVLSFDIRKGVYFHDGTLLNAGLVKQALKRKIAQRSGIMQRWDHLLEMISAVRAPAENRLDIVLKKKSPEFLLALSDPTFTITLAVGDRVSGTGAWVPAEWIRGSHLLLRNNAMHWSGGRSRNELLLKKVTDPMERVLQFKNGSAAVIQVLSAREVTELAGFPRAVMQKGRIWPFYYLLFNTSRPPLDRLEVRRLFAHLVNKEVLVKQIFQSLALPAVSIFPPFFEVFNSDLRDYSFDPARAAELLKQAGLPEGFSCEIVFTEGQQGVAEFIDGMIRSSRSLQIRLKKKELSFDELIKVRYSGDFDLLIMGFQGAAHPSAYLTSVFSLKQKHKSPDFFSGRWLEKLQELAASPGHEDPHLYRELQQQILDDLPILPLYHHKNVLVRDRGMNELRHSGHGFLDYNSIFRE